MSSSKHILFHRPTPWENDINCSTKTYARLFEQVGYKVTYLQSSINYGHRLLKRGYYHTWKLGARMEHGVWVTGGCSIIPHIDNRSRLLASITARNSYLTSIPSIKSLVMESGYGEPDIIWTTIPGSTVLKRIFPKSKLFFHVVDKYSAYRGASVKELERQDYLQSDHNFVIGEALRRYVRTEFGVPDNKITNLGQGVDIAKYQGSFEKPHEMKNLKGPIAIWVGVLNKLDVGLLKVTIEELQSKGGSLVLIGPSTDWLSTVLDEYDCVHYLGSKSSVELSTYLRSADIGLMIYDRDKKEIYEGQHPLKLYEYAAAGLPVVSTYHTEFDTLKPPVEVVSDEHQIPTVLNLLIENKEYYSKQMVSFALSHSWEACRQKAELLF